MSGEVGPNGVRKFVFKYDPIFQTIDTETLVEMIRDPDTPIIPLKQAKYEYRKRYLRNKIRNLKLGPESKEAKMLERLKSDGQPRRVKPEIHIFCQAYVTNGFDHIEAYKKAFPDCKHETASRVATRYLNGNTVQYWVQQYLRKVWKKMALSKDEIEEKMKEVYGKALEDGDYAPAVKAVELMAKAAGMLIDKVETKSQVQVNSVQDIEARIAQIDSMLVAEELISAPIEQKVLSDDR